MKEANIHYVVRAKRAKETLSFRTGDGVVILPTSYNDKIILSVCRENGIGGIVGFNGSNWTVQQTAYAGMTEPCYIYYIEQPAT